MPLYVYAIVKRPVRARSLSSGTGVRLRPVIGGGAVAIVADCDDRPSPTLSALRKHDAVVRRIGRAVPAILPVRFGTIVDTDRSLMGLLEAVVLGLFCALDLLLFFVFFEALLVPMFLIIGVWGSSRRVYASLKFFLFTMLGSAFILVATLYLWFQTSEQLGNLQTSITTLVGNLSGILDGPRENGVLGALHAAALALGHPLM